MLKERPYVLTIAGFDPSGGAGILADIKTLEANNVHGLGVCTSITFQNDKTFQGLDWLTVDQIISQLDILFSEYQIHVIKIGLIKDLKTLLFIIKHIKTKNHAAQIIWDPILNASAGFEFHSSINNSELQEVLKNITLITPNIPEAEKLKLDPSTLHCACLLKGGHGTDHANDILYSNGTMNIIQGERLETAEKHGSGCVLSSAIAAGLSQGLELLDACIKAKLYTAGFLKSTENLLGIHSLKQDEYA
jgi:hydroxymethylpyrimidine/phosphomethylpyrimidine kinase